MGGGISLQLQWNPLLLLLLLLLTSPCKTPHYLTSNLTPRLHCLFILLSFSCLASLLAPRRCFKKLCSPRWALNLNSCQDFVDPSPLTGAITDCSCFSYFFSLCDPVKTINWHDGYCMCSYAGSYPSFTVFQINNLSPLIFLSNIIGLPAGHDS